MNEYMLKIAIDASGGDEYGDDAYGAGVFDGFGDCHNLLVPLLKEALVAVEALARGNTRLLPDDFYFGGGGFTGLVERIKQVTED